MFPLKALQKRVHFVRTAGGLQSPDGTPVWYYYTKRHPLPALREEDMEVVRTAVKLLARDAGFTAVFCMSDIMAVGAMRALTDAGLRVPQDISVLGFDGIELGQYVVPRLATVSQPQQEIADQSVALLLGQIEKAAPPQTRVVSTGLLEGESVASVTSDI